MTGGPAGDAGPVGRVGPVRIVGVDPGDADAVAAWHGVQAEVDRVDRSATADTWSLAEVTAELRRPSAYWRRLPFLAVEDGAAVGAAWAALSLQDNPHRAELFVAVLPQHRRRGVGTALLHHLEALARADGRSVAGAEAEWPVAAGPEATGCAGPAFLRRHGYACVLLDVQRRLALPVDAGLLDRLAAEAAAHHAAYRLHSWVGPVPEALVEGWARLDASLEMEAPTGGLSLQPRAAAVARVRESEALQAAQQRTSYATVALDAGGEMVAYSQILLGADGAGLAYQEGTLVRREDRGHRLGLAVKVANLRLLQRHAPTIAAELVTYNAASNAPMVAVNDRLGFRAVEWSGEFQRDL